jgi:hypothetical protein
MIHVLFLELELPAPDVDVFFGTPSKFLAISWGVFIGLAYVILKRITLH